MEQEEKTGQFILDRVVSTENDVERPHYEFKFHGNIYYLPLHKELDSESYRNKLLGLLNHNKSIESFGRYLDFLKDKSVDVHSQQRVSDIDTRIFSVMKDLQNGLDSSLFEDKIKETYGMSYDPLEVVSVDLQRSTMRLRFNYLPLNHNSQEGDLSAYINGPMVDVPLCKNRKDTVLLLTELHKQHTLTTAFEQCSEWFNYDRYVNYGDRHRDVMFSGKELEHVSALIHGIDLDMVREQRDESKKKELALLTNARKKVCDSMKSLEDIQRKHDKEYFGLGYVLDRTVGRKEYLYRKELYEKCESSLRNLDKEEEKIKGPDTCSLLLSGMLAAEEAKATIKMRLQQIQSLSHTDEKLNVVFEPASSKQKDRGHSAML